NPQTVVQIQLPQRRIPLLRAALEQFAAPDVVDENIDMAVVLADPVGQPADLVSLQMIERDRDPVAAQFGYQLGGLLDRLGPVVIRCQGRIAAAAPGADHGRAGFTQCGGDSAPGAPGRTGDDSYPAP